MVVFRPFRGCRFNPQVVGDPAQVICPPYDMIGPELQRSLKQVSPYNAVHLEGGEQPDPVDPEAGYRQAASLFQQWLAQGALLRDSQPRFYLMRHGYRFQGEERNQLGLFGGVRVEDYASGVVLPHEYTREPAVRDRVLLLEACRAQFSPIMSLYRDATGACREVLTRVMSGKPVLEVRDSADDDTTFWEIADPAIQEEISRLFADKVVFLADGHHRYEAALRYHENQHENQHGDQHGDQASRQPSSAGAADNFVMMALVEFDDPGLLLLPYHRAISGLDQTNLTRLWELLEEIFEIRPFDLTTGGGAAGLAEQVAALGKQRQVVGLVGPGQPEAWLLLLREEVDRQGWGSMAVSEAWILEEMVFKPLLGEEVNRHVDYGHDYGQLMEEVMAGSKQLAFLLKPFPMNAFEEIVGGGQRLPSKSTFFYPKLPTGLVIHQLEGEL